MKKNGKEKGKEGINEEKKWEKKWKNLQFNIKLSHGKKWEKGCVQDEQMIGKKLWMITQSEKSTKQLNKRKKK